MILSFILCVILIMMDRIAKMVAVQVLMPVGVLPAIPGIFEWRYVENTGAAFSFLAGRQTLLIVVTSIALLIVAYLILFRRPKAKMEYIALILIFSGGVGNLIDRIAQGYVVDYICLQFMNFAVFNLADIFVTVGFAILVVSVVRAELRAKKQKNSGGGEANGPSDKTMPAPAGQASEETPVETLETQEDAQAEQAPPPTEEGGTPPADDPGTP